MAENSKIQWCDSTGNPWIGCTKKKFANGRMRRGCAHCYAETLDRNRFSKTLGGATKENPIIHWGEGAPRYYRLENARKEAEKWNREAAKFLWRCDICGYGYSTPYLNCFHGECTGLISMRNPRVFPSLCDWLDEEVPIEKLAEFLSIIRDTPNLNWLILSKRPELFESRLSGVMKHNENSRGSSSLHGWVLDWVSGKPPSNVWAGASCEDQPSADETIPELLKIPARIRFLSVEPMVAKINLTYPCFNGADSLGAMPGIHWVIYGGESGPKAAPCKVEWIRDGVRQCRDAGVKVFLKQLGSRPCCDCSVSAEAFSANCCEHFPYPIRDAKGGDMSEWPEDLRVREFPS